MAKNPKSIKKAIAAPRVPNVRRVVATLDAALPPGVPANGPEAFTYVLTYKYDGAGGWDEITKPADKWKFTWKGAAGSAVLGADKPPLFYMGDDAGFHWFSECPPSNGSPMLPKGSRMWGLEVKPSPWLAPDDPRSFCRVCKMSFGGTSTDKVGLATKT